MRYPPLIHDPIRLIDCSGNGKISIQGVTADSLLQASDLPIGAGKELNFGQLYRLRHNLFYLSTSPGEETAVVQQLERQIRQSGEFVTVTDMTHGRAEFCLVGRQSPELFSRLCGLDFHPAHFPNLAARQSSVAKTSQLILRRDIEEQPAYSLIGARSFGAYLWETILKAGRDSEVQPLGQATLGD